jgi:hypothetical protein
MGFARGGSNPPLFITFLRFFCTNSRVDPMHIRGDMTVQSYWSVFNVYVDSFALLCYFHKHDTRML